jgi:hypothetical protein
MGLEKKRARLSKAIAKLMLASYLMKHNSPGSIPPEELIAEAVKLLKRIV